MTAISTAYQDAPRRCAAKTKAGEPCQAWAMEGSAYCYQHAPEVAAERTAARSRGGRARHGRTLNRDNWQPSYDLDAKTMLQEAQDVALALEPSVAKARVLGYLAGVTHTVIKADELEERLTALEEAAGVTK